LLRVQQYSGNGAKKVNNSGTVTVN